MSAPLRVAVVDSGWDRRLAGPAVAAGRAFVGDDPRDDHDRLGHGTACIRRVLEHAPGARVVPVRIFGDHPETSPEALAAAIVWAAEAGARVISLSVGMRREDAAQQVEQACAHALQAGALVVAAGPNSGPPTLPAALPGVVGVWRARYPAAPGAIRRVGTGLDLEVPSAGSRLGTSLAAAEVAGRITALLAAGHPPAADALLDRIAVRSP